MDHLFYLLLPTVFYGIAVQQLLELFYSLRTPANWQRYQKPISKSFAFLAGAAWTALVFPRRTAMAPRLDEILLAGLLTAGSAELSNALIKFLVYAKENKKAAAANALSTSGSISLEAVSRK